jgi:hypothetical protein
MTIPAFPFTVDQVRIVAWAVSADLPRAMFQPDFGPPITRPRSTAMDEVAQITVILMPGNLPGFREWWATVARGGPFTWTRPDADEAVLVTPMGGYQQETILGRRPGMADEVVRLSFSAHIQPATVVP